MGTLTSAPTDSKPIIQSSTVGLNAVIGIVTGLVSAFWPTGSAFLSAHPAAIIGATTIINALWRIFVTKQPISGVLSTPS